MSSTRNAAPELPRSCPRASQPHSRQPPLVHWGGYLLCVEVAASTQIARHGRKHGIAIFKYYQSEAEVRRGPLIERYTFYPSLAMVRRRISSQLWRAWSQVSSRRRCMLTRANLSRSPLRDNKPDSSVFTSTIRKSYSTRLVDYVK